MIIHGNWVKSQMSSGEFIIWGEAGNTIYKQRGRRTEQSLSIYPQLVKPEELYEHIPLSTKQGTAEILVAQLADGKNYSIYTIKGLILSPAEVFKLGISLASGLDQANRVDLADDFLYWIQTIRLTAEILINHRYLPVVTASDNNKGYLANWQIFTQHPGDMYRRKLLLDSMPPICRAVFPQGSYQKQLIVSDRSEHLTSFMDWVADGVIRQIPQTTWDLVIGILKSEEGNNWRRALGTQGGRLSGNPNQLKSIVEGYDEWISPLKRGMDSRHFRTCFRINPPEYGQETCFRINPSGQEAWRLEYLLQANDDLSLLLPAEQIWRQAGDTVTYLNRRFYQPQEHLLNDLGEAARLFPPIIKSLYHAAPSYCELTLEEAYQFLQQGAIMLEDSGFGILAPAWWNKPSRLTMKLRSKKSKSNNVAGKSRFGLNTVLQYDWQAAIGEDILSAEEFQQLAALKTPLIQIRGQWMELKSSQLTGLYEMWKKHQDGLEISISDVLRQSLGGEEIIPGVPMESMEQDKAVREFIHSLIAEDGLKELPTPQGFHGSLRPYQVRGFSWLVFLREHGMGACLADDMGLGKTIQLISLLLYERDKGCVDKPTLLLCPTSVVGNWHKELKKFAPSLKVMIHHGNTRLKGNEFSDSAMKHDVVVTTYALVVKDEQYLSAVSWAGTVLDEAQNIKNNSTKQTQVVKRLKQDYRVALTGTPVENRLSELWSIMDFLNPGYMGNWTQFKTRYAVPIEKENNGQAKGKLTALLSPFILRRVKTDPNIIQDLPEKIEMKVYCSLTREQATLYEAVVKDMMTAIEDSEGIARKGIVLATLTRLKQICNHPVHFLKDNSDLADRSGKLKRLLEMLEEMVDKKERALLFTQFKEMGTMLQDIINRHLGVQTLFLHGGVPRKKREEMVESFQRDTQAPPIFILSLKAGGVGLNLTNANHVFHFDRWWNPAVENQATDRAFRIGQTKNVEVYKFITLGTIEERIDEMLEEKQALANSIIGSGENWITEMSNDQLKELFRLDKSDILDDEEVG